MLQLNIRVSTCMPVQMQLENSTSVDVLLQLSISRVGTSEDALISFQKSSDTAHGPWGDHKQKNEKFLPIFEILQAVAM